MLPTMMTQSAGPPIATSRGGGTGGRAGSGSCRTRGHSGNQGDGRIDGQGGQVGGQGSEVNDGFNRVPDFPTIIAHQLQNLLPTIEFLACNPKEYDGKGGAIVYTHWIEKMESVLDMSGCRDSQKILTGEEFCLNNEMQKLETKLWNHAMVEAGHATYTDRFHDLSRLVPYLVTPEGKRIKRYVYGLAPQIRGMVAATEPKTIQKAIQIVEPSKDRNVRDDNKRTKTGNTFATTTNPVRGGYTGTAPKCTTYSYHHSPEPLCRSCFNYNRLGHFVKDCRVAPRNVSPINARNPVARTCYEYGSIDHIKSAYPKLNQAQRIGGNHQNQVVAVNEVSVVGTNGIRKSFVYTTFIPLLHIEPSKLGFSYEIKIASGQLVEIDKVIKGCKLEIEGHVVRIPLLDRKVLRVLGEKLEEEMRHLMSAKANEKKQEDIVVVKNFPEVFSNDLSGLPPYNNP
nr:hypothetical protein [Tanacetum cinerariifolium]